MADSADEEEGDEEEDVEEDDDEYARSVHDELAETSLPTTRANSTSTPPGDRHLARSAHTHTHRERERETSTHPPIHPSTHLSIHVCVQTIDSLARDPRNPSDYHRDYFQFVQSVMPNGQYGTPLNQGDGGQEERRKLCRH